MFIAAFHMMAGGPDGGVTPLGGRPVDPRWRVEFASSTKKFSAATRTAYRAHVVNAAH
jgi:hypothetical protein